MNRLLRTITRTLFPVWILILATSCGGGSEEAPPGTSPEPASVVQPVGNTPPAGARALAAGQQAIPVYNNFEDLAPLFEHKNDSTYVINFWATWCKPCVEELPYFEQLHRATAGKKVRIVLVSLDFERDLEDKLVPFVRQHDLRSEVVVLLDGNYNNWIDRVDPEWSGAIPVTLIYNAGERRFIGEQFSSFAELEGLVKKMM